MPVTKIAGQKNGHGKCSKLSVARAGGGAGSQAGPDYPRYVHDANATNPQNVEFAVLAQKQRTAGRLRRPAQRKKTKLERDLGIMKNAIENEAATITDVVYVKLENGAELVLVDHVWRELTAAENAE